ncbi:hypothetical protein ACP70R_003043 [Stipagrostis hirtigluma subsp. patula]
MASPRRQSRGATRGVTALRQRAVQCGGWSVAGDNSGEQLFGCVFGADGGEVGDREAPRRRCWWFLLATLAPGRAASGAELRARTALGTMIRTRVKVGKQ